MIKDYTMYKANRPKHKEYSKQKKRIIITILKSAVVKKCLYRL